MKAFGLQLFSIRDQYQSESDIRNAFLEIAKMGYTYAQTAGTYPCIAPEKFAEYAKDAGIEICGTHYDWDLIRNDIEGTVKYHNTIGTKLIGIGGAPGLDSKEAVLNFIAEYNRLAEIYANYGFKLTYHNHAIEGKKYEGKSILEYLIEGFSDNISFCLDSYWLQHAGFDVCDIIERIPGRIDILHLKDMAAFIPYKLEGGATLYAPRMIEVGSGNMNFARIIKAAEKAGAKYFIVEDEYYSTGVPMESVKISADYIKANLIEE